LVRLIPRDRILTETDCPYVAPFPHRGKVNEPSFIPFILKKLAEIRGIEEEVFSEEVIENFRRAFRID
jgi:TatD DNase family protein